MITALSIAISGPTAMKTVTIKTTIRENIIPSPTFSPKNAPSIEKIAPTRNAIQLCENSSQYVARANEAPEPRMRAKKYPPTPDRNFFSLLSLSVICQPNPVSAALLISVHGSALFDFGHFFSQCHESISGKIPRPSAFLDAFILPNWIDL